MNLVRIPSVKGIRCPDSPDKQCNDPSTVNMMVLPVLPEE